jgi:hypothetical protein
VAASRGAIAVIVYTALRIALAVAVYLVVEFFTPIHGVWALVTAILVSGAISLLVLDRQRDAAARVAGGLLTRINDRIDASTRAEDDDAPVPQARSGERDEDAEHDPVDEEEQARALEHRDEGGTARSGRDLPDGGDGEHSGERGEGDRP